jgi:hypothetical protein
VKRGPGGWESVPKRKNTKKKTASKKSVSSKPEQRRAQRADARSAKRTSGRSAKGTGKNLARDYQQGAGGHMNGSAPMPAGMPTPRQATGLTRLGCDWCRSSGMRAIYTGDGQIKTVIAVQPCNHRWSSRASGPAQKPADRKDKFLCPPCGNTGQLVITTTRHRDGAQTKGVIVCPICQGWIRHW